MKKTKLILFIGLVLAGGLYAEDPPKKKMFVPRNFPGNKLLYLGGPNITINNRNDKIISGSWPVSPGNCPTRTTAYSATSDTYVISKYTSGFSTGSLTYTATSAGTTNLYERRATYSLDYWLDGGNGWVCDIGSPGSYSSYGDYPYTISVEAYKWNSPPTSACSYDTGGINLSSYISHTSGTAYTISPNRGLSGSTFTPSTAGAGTYTITATRTFSNGTTSKSFVLIVYNPPTITFTSSSGTYCTSEGSINLNTESGASPTGGSWSKVSGSGSVAGPTYTFSGATTAVLRYTKTTNGCTSTRDFTTSVNANPGAPTIVTGGGSFCGSQSITLTASGGSGSSTYKYYSANSGGTLLYTGASWTQTLGVATYNYYVGTSKNGCESTTRKAVTVTIKPFPTVTMSKNAASYCVSDGTTNLTSESGVSPTNGTWTVISGNGAILGAVLSFASASTVVTNYAVTLNGCVTNKIFTATINANPNTPTTVTGAGDYCGTQDVTLTASGSTAGSIYKYYSASSGGSLLYTGATWDQMLGVGNYSYYVEAALNGCISPSRLQAVVNVKASPAAPADLTADSGCANQVPVSIDLQVQSSGGTIEWWSETGLITTGGTYTANVSVTTTFKAREVLNGCPGPYTTVQAIVHPEPVTPTANNQSRCGNGPVTLSVSGISGTTYRWYSDEFGGGQIASGLTYDTPVLSADQIYWFEYTDDNGCNTSSRVAVTATINPLPAGVVVSDVHRCEAGTISLATSNPIPGTTYKWYDIAIGGSELATGTGYITPVLLLSTPYYVETISNAGCLALSRTLVTAFVEPNPGAPTAIHQSICTNGSVVLTAAGKPTGGTYRWYDASGIFLADGDTYTSAILTINTNFLVSALSQYGCESTQDILTLVVDTDISAPLLSGDQACVTGVLTLNATGGVAGDVYKWFDSDVSGLEVSTGPNFVTPELSVTTTYWAEIERPSGCTSPRVSIDAIINPLPIVTSGGDVFLCTIADTYDLTQDENPLGGTWTGSGVSGNVFYATSTGAGVFTIQYEYTDPSNGCTNSNLKTMNVAQTVVVDAGPDISMCPDSSVIDLFNQSFSPAGGVWSSPDPEVHANIADAARMLDVGGLTPGTYPVIYSVGQSGCQSTDQFVLTIYANPNEPTLQEGAVCGGGGAGAGAVELKLLGAATGEAYYWYIEITDTDPFNTGGSFVTPTITKSQTYYVSLVNSTTGCEGNRIPITATVYVVPTVDAGPDLLICDPVTIDLEDDPNLLGGIWSGPGMAGNLWSPSGLTDGEHIITYTYQTADGCTTADSRVFTIGLDGSVTITADDFSINAPVYFTSSFASEDIKNIEWEFGDNINSFQVEPIHYYYAPGIFDIAYTIELNSGCQGTFTFPVAVSISGDPIDVIVGIEDPAELKNFISVYPTIVENKLHLQYNSVKNEELKIRFFTSTGVLYYELKTSVQEGLNEIELSDEVVNLSSQIYYLVIKDQVFKIIKK